MDMMAFIGLLRLHMFIGVGVTRGWMSSQDITTAVAMVAINRFDLSNVTMGIALAFLSWFPGWLGMSGKEVLGVDLPCAYGEPLRVGSEGSCAELKPNDEERQVHDKGDG